MPSVSSIHNITRADWEAIRRHLTTDFPIGRSLTAHPEATDSEVKAYLRAVAQTAVRTTVDGIREN